MRKWMVCIGLSVWATGLTGCEDDVVIASGGLDRPSGLAYIPRPSQTTEAGVELRRSDVFIADSEAQGVRVLQFSEVADDANEVVGWSRFFVPAPVVFFQVAVDAPGFPEPIEVSPPVNEQPAYAFVLAYTSNQLHVLEVDNLPFETSSISSTNVRRGSVDLSPLAERFNGLPVDIARMGRSADGQSEQMLLSFDGFGGAEGAVVLLEVSLTNFGQFETLSEIRIPNGVLDMLYRPDEGKVLLTAAENDDGIHSVTEVSLTDEGVFDTPDTLRSIATRGPISRLVNFGDTGVLALRADRPAVEWLPWLDDQGGFDRTEETLLSPYDSGAVPEELGVLTVRSPIPVIGAHARLNRLGTVSQTGILFEGQTERDVALLVHANGVATYVIGPDPDNAEATVPQVGVIDDGRELTFLASPVMPIEPVDDDDDAADDDAADDEDEEAPPPILSIDGCEDRYFSTCIELAETSTTPICSTPVLRRDRPAALNATVRVTAGELMSGVNVAFSFVDAFTAEEPSVDAPIPVEIVDSLTGFLGIPPFFGDSLIRRTSNDPNALPPDRARMELSLLCDSDSTDITVVVLAGDVAELDLNGEDVRLVEDDTEDPSTLTVEGYRVVVDVDEIVSAFRGTTSIADPFGECAEVLTGGALEAPEQITARRFKVHMPLDADPAEAVLTSATGEQILGIYERVPIIDDGAGGPAEMTFGEGDPVIPDDPDAPLIPASPIQATVEAPGGVASLACELRDSETGTGTLPSLCVTTSDCAGLLGEETSWSCAPPGVLCSVGCVCSGEDCELGSYFTLNCPRLDLTLFSTEVSLDLRSISVTGSSLVQGPGTVPGDVIFNDQLESFFVSFPGAQSLIEVPTSTAALSRIR